MYCDKNVNRNNYSHADKASGFYFSHYCLESRLLENDSNTTKINKYLKLYLYFIGSPSMIDVNQPYTNRLAAKYF
jgi:hypothetical protein